MRVYPLYGHYISVWRIRIYKKRIWPLWKADPNSFKKGILESGSYRLKKSYSLWTDPDARLFLPLLGFAGSRSIHFPNPTRKNSDPIPKKTADPDPIHCYISENTNTLINIHTSRISKQEVGESTNKRERVEILYRVHTGDWGKRKSYIWGNRSSLNSPHNRFFPLKFIRSQNIGENRCREQF